MIIKQKSILYKFVLLTLIMALAASIMPARNVYAEAPPSVLTIIVEGATYVKLKWVDNLTGEKGYRIDRKVDSGVFTEVGSVSANTADWWDWNASGSHTYTYRVRSYDASGNYNIHTNEVAVSTGAVEKPNSLILNPVSESQVDLSWSYPNARNYDTVVERSLEGASSWQQIAVVPAGTNSYSDKGLYINTRYHYRIKAVYNSNVFSVTCPSDYGNYVYTKLAAPTELNAFAASPTQICLTWVDKNYNPEDSKTKVYYEIQRKDGSGEFKSVGTAYPGVTTWVDSGLAPHETYIYRIRARSTIGIEYVNFSNFTDELTVKCTYLEAPGNLSAVSISGSEIKLEWRDYSTTETEFEIWRKAGETGKWEKYASVDRNVTSYIDDDISPDIAYSYRVRGYVLYNSVYSAFTNTAGVWTVKLSPATGLQFSVTSNNEVKLEWEDNSRNETGYAVEKKIGIDGQWVQIALLPYNYTSYTDKNVNLSDKYYYRVKVFDDVYYRNFEYSEEIPVSMKAPAQPSGLSAEVVSSGKIRLRWKDSSLNESGFKIERGTGGLWSYAEVAQVGLDVTEYLDSSLKSGTKYYYRVRAFNSAGNSNYCPEVYASTYARKAYKDVPASYWAKAEIEDLVSRGVFKTTSGEYFRPGNRITRGELAYILVKAFKLNKTAVGSFADVNAKHTYYKEIMIADKMGVITRSSSNYFYPDRLVSREEMAVFVCRALKAAGKPLKEYDLSILEAFSDKQLVSKGALQNIASLFGGEIMVGKNKNGKMVIAPKDSVARADAAVVIYKVIDMN